MLKKIINYAVVTMIIIGLGLYSYDSHLKVKKLEDELTGVKSQEAQDIALGQYVINMMYAVGAGDKLSDAKKLILARSIVRVANDVFDNTEHRKEFVKELYDPITAKKGFVTVLAIESSFNRFAQSPTGPKGLGQLAKASFHEAVKDCGMQNAHDDDVWETELNLYAAACYFTKMLAASNNDPGLAIVFYNQGPNSKAGKQYAKYGTMDNIEALKYVARFNFLTRSVTDEKTSGIPSIKDLPKPVSNTRTDKPNPEAQTKDVAASK